MIGAPVPINKKVVYKYSDMPTFTIEAVGGTNRVSRIDGGYIVEDGVCHVRMVLKLLHNLTSVPSAENGPALYHIGVLLPKPKNKYCVRLNADFCKKDNNNWYQTLSWGCAVVDDTVWQSEYAASASLKIGTNIALDGTSNDIYITVIGDYEVN